MSVKKNNQQIESLKKFWAENKTKIFITTTVILAIGAAIQKQALAEHEDFLEERDLLEDFYKSIGANEDDIASFKL